MIKAGPVQAVSITPNRPANGQRSEPHRPQSIPHANQSEPRRQSKAPGNTTAENSRQASVRQPPVQQTNNVRPQSPDRSMNDRSLSNIYEADIELQRMILEFHNTHHASPDGKPVPRQVVGEDVNLRQPSKFDVEKMTFHCDDETGLDRNTIDSMFAVKFDVKVHGKDADTPMTCNICLVDFKDGDMLKLLQCLHSFHVACIDGWLGKKSVCPECKFNIRSMVICQFY